MLRFIFSLLLAAIFSAGVINAQLAPGQWRFHPAFQAGATKHIAVTPDKVYFLSGINLFSYNPSTQETVSYTKDNGLSDIKLSSMFHNSEKNYLFLVYKNGNIDFLYPDGRIVNLSALRDANIQGERTVRDVAFYGDKAFVSTDFGLVVIDTAKHRVIESGQYRGGTDANGLPLPSGGPDKLLTVGKRLLALFGDKLYESFPDDSSVSYREGAKHKYLGTLKTGHWARYSDDTILLTISEAGVGPNVVHSLTFPIEAAQGDIPTLREGVNLVQVTGLWEDSGNIYALSASNPVYLVKVTPNSHSIVTEFPLATTSVIAVDSRNSLRDSWIATPSGLLRYNLSDRPASLTFGPYSPDAPSVTNVSAFSPDPSGESFYVFTRSSSSFLSSAGSKAEPLQIENRATDYRGLWTPGFLDKVQGEEVFSVTPSVAGLYSLSNGQGSSQTNSIARRYGDVIPTPNAVAVNPAAPDDMWIGSVSEGVYRVRSGKAESLYAGDFTGTHSTKYDNIPIAGYSIQYVNDLYFDREGNLWVYASNVNESAPNLDDPAPQLMMLPARYTTAPASSITKDKWITTYGSKRSNLNLPNMVTYFDGRLTPMQIRNTFVLTGFIYREGMVLYHHKGTLSDTSDDTSTHLSSVTDQDGNTISMEGVTTVAEDHAGNLIVATTDAFFMIPDADTFDPARDRVRRFKVPRNDGTGTADYLLDKAVISGIDFDDAGRMWVATEGSGISVISPRYDEVLQNFNSENSPLPTDFVSAIYVSPFSNKIYIGSTYGLGEFASDQSPAKEDFSQARAYPNPVRPEFRGNVTIDGLMASSLVKIVDAMGNTVYTGTSTGGSMTWNLRDINGARVKSGVYYVMPSQNADESGPGGTVACKILVLR